MAIALFLYLLALVCWLGGMFFFTVIVAPVVFKLLPLAAGGKLVAGLFPRYEGRGAEAAVRWVSRKAAHRGHTSTCCRRS